LVVNFDSMYKQKKQYRLFGYDYSASGFYFVTVLTKNRLPYFGSIENNEMNYLPIGKCAMENIQKFCEDKSADNPYHRNPYYVKGSEYLISIDNWVIMPNHIHLIVEILKQDNQEMSFAQGLQPLQMGSLGSFMNHFKGKVKRFANENQIEFEWQARFHDRIIRDDREYTSISQYIDMNIQNWKTDIENVKF